MHFKILAVFLFIASTLLGQEKVQIDFNVSVIFPDKPTKTNKNNMDEGWSLSNFLYYSNSFEEEYGCNHLTVNLSSRDASFKDPKEIKLRYNECCEDLIDEYAIDGYEFTDSGSVDISGWTGYKIELDHLEDSSHAEFRMIIVDEELYLFWYIGAPPNARNKEEFFKSIWINPHAEKEYDGFFSYKVVQITIALILVAIIGFIIRYQMNKSESRKNFQ